MKVYIGYKYTNVKDKNQLITTLEEISKLITDQGNNTFVLGRDVKKWQHVHLGSIKLIPVIYKNMKACDKFIAYVDSPEYSKGLFFEAIISRLLNIKSVLFLKDDTKKPLYHILFSKVNRIQQLGEINLN